MHFFPLSLPLGSSRASPCSAKLMHEKAAPLKSPEPMHGREKLEASHKEKSLDSLDGR